VGPAQAEPATPAEVEGEEQIAVEQAEQLECSEAPEATVTWAATQDLPAAVLAILAV
jgi:hypothetical protein